MKILAAILAGLMALVVLVAVAALITDRSSPIPFRNRRAGR